MTQECLETRCSDSLRAEPPPELAVVTSTSTRCHLKTGGATTMLKTGGAQRACVRYPGPCVRERGGAVVSAPSLWRPRMLLSLPHPRLHRLLSLMHPCLWQARSSHWSCRRSRRSRSPPVERLPRVLRQLICRCCLLRPLPLPLSILWLIPPSGALTGLAALVVLHTSCLHHSFPTAISTMMSTPTRTSPRHSRLRSAAVPSKKPWLPTRRS